MSAFSLPPPSLRLLLVCDCDIANSAKLADRFVRERPQIDLIVAMGPFADKEAATGEQVAMAEGDVASILAQLENIACRVVYVPYESDPAAALQVGAHLTPNAINIHGRRLQLTEDLAITGFAENVTDMAMHDLPHDDDRSPESDDELEGVQVNVSNSIGVIRSMLQRSLDDAAAGPPGTGGLFALNYKFASTLNSVLFHIPEVPYRHLPPATPHSLTPLTLVCQLLAANGISTVVVPAGVAPDVRLPQRLGNMHIISVSATSSLVYYFAHAYASL